MDSGKENMRVMLINPSVSPIEIYGKYRRLGAVIPPLGLCYIAAVLEKNGYRVRILDANALRLSKAEILEYIRQFTPGLVGIYSATMSFYNAQNIAQAVKKLDPRIKTVLGGPHISAMPHESMQEGFFDFGAIGEGEYTALQLIEALENSGNLSKVDGLIRYEGDVIANAPRQPIKDLDSLPFPARHLLPPLDIYKPKAIMYKKLPSTQIFTSRGCPYQCVFCQNPFGRRVRYHSPEYVVSEIEHLTKDYGIRDIVINDDTFTVNKERVHEICDLIDRRNIDIKWSCNVRVDCVDLPLLKRMKGAGCWLIMPGLESGNDGILKTLKKGITVEQGRNVCRWARQVGLWIKPSFIIGNPLETENSIEDTIEFAVSLKTHYPSFALMTPLPGAELWETAEQYGVFDRSDLAKLTPSQNACFVPYGLCADYLIRKQKEAFRRCYLNLGMIIRHLKGISSFEDVRKMSHAAMAIVH